MISQAKKKIHELEDRRNQLKQRYVGEAFKASGYKVGQKILDREKKVWFVAGARELSGRVILSLNPARKDGTMAKVTFIARGEPKIFLN